MLGGVLGGRLGLVTVTGDRFDLEGLLGDWGRLGVVRRGRDAHQALDLQTVERQQILQLRFEFLGREAERGAAA